jgi:hypothetical protein
MAVLTREKLGGDGASKELISALSMTPVDMMDLWAKIVEFFPSEVKKSDFPEKFFLQDREGELSQAEKRITLPETKKYEERLKAILADVAEKFPEKFDEMQARCVPNQPLGAACEGFCGRGVSPRQPSSEPASVSEGRA